MPGELETFLLNLAQGPAVLITVEDTRGSVPREPGAWMAVFADATRGEVGTIGGGQLEWKATQQARDALARRSPARRPGTSCMAGKRDAGAEPGPVLRWRAGAALRAGGCLARGAVARAPAAIAHAAGVVRRRARGAGDRAGAGALAVRRDAGSTAATACFRQACRRRCCTEHSDPVHAAVRDVPAGACVLVMSFSHAEDLDVVAACLQRQRERNDLAFIGLIGSRTKWATFCTPPERAGFHGGRAEPRDLPDWLARH